MYKVNIQYFQKSGKYYTEGFYYSNRERLYEIWEEIRTMLDEGIRPGLIFCGEGRNEFIALIKVPDHPHNHPYLVMPKEKK